MGYMGIMGMPGFAGKVAVPGAVIGMGLAATVGPLLLDVRFAYPELRGSGRTEAGFARREALDLAGMSVRRQEPAFFFES